MSDQVENLGVLDLYRGSSFGPRASLASLSPASPSLTIPVEFDWHSYVHVAQAGHWLRGQCLGDPLCVRPRAGNLGKEHLLDTLRDHLLEVLLRHVGGLRN